MSFALSLEFTTKGCLLDNQVLTGNIISGLIKGSDSVEALVDNVSTPIHLQSGELFIVDISSLTLTQGIHTLKIQSTNPDNPFDTFSCEAYILVFDDQKIVVNELDCKKLLKFFEAQPAKIVGIIIGFVTSHLNLTSPCNCIKPLLLDGLSLKKFGGIYGYAVKVLESEGKRIIKSFKDFHEDFMCLGIQREWLSPLYCQLMEILDFPRTKDICVQTECKLSIDLSKIVSNHKSDFTYELVGLDITGEACVKGTCLLYTPPPQSLFSIYLVGYITYKVTNGQGKSSEGTVTIKMV
ncbi:MAG: hypothetical protein H6850_01685 [Alphaproteobacteria bacterium]|nr:MAG: hypothetical protein H6850_01685 [Alphaproteobacteria bacterium]